MPSVEQSERIGGAAFLGVPALDFFVWALDNYARIELLMRIHNQLPSFLVSPTTQFVCLCIGLGLLYLSHKRQLRRVTVAASTERRLVDTSGVEYSTIENPKWLIPVGIAFGLALVAAPILAIGYSLAYKGTPPAPLKDMVLPPFASLTTKELARPRPMRGKAAVNIKQTGGTNIAQVGNNNTAAVTATIPFRVLTDNQKQRISDLRMPRV
jgi:hypothetical protein